MNQEEVEGVVAPSEVDVAVVGGGAAGLTAALTLARSRRRVVVVDAGAPRNAPAAGVHGFLTRDGTSPAELLALGRAEVERYGAVIVDGVVAAVAQVAEGFVLSLGDGTTVTARRLVVATGLVDELPDVAGVRERWGRDVLHCPYCHGWEVRDQALAVLGTGPLAVHQALLFRQLTSDVVLFNHTAPTPSAEEAEQLAARGIDVVGGQVASLEVVDDRITGVCMVDGRVFPRQAVVVGPRFVARSEVLAALGLQPVAHPAGVGHHVPSDPTGRTDVPGVWVAGNVTDLTAQVVGAAAAGVMAGAAVNAALVAEETRLAVAARRGEVLAG